MSDLKLCLSNLENLQRDADMEKAADEDKFVPSTSAKPASSRAATKIRLLADNEKGLDIRKIAMEVYKKKKKVLKEDIASDSEHSAESEQDPGLSAPRKKKKKKMTFEDAFIQKMKMETQLRVRELMLKERELEVRMKEVEVKHAELNAGKTTTQTMP